MQNAAVSLHIFAIIGMILKSLKFIKIRMEFLRAISCSSHEGCPFHSRYSQMGVLGNHFGFLCSDNTPLHTSLVRWEQGWSCLQIEKKKKPE